MLKYHGMNEVRLLAVAPTSHDGDIVELRAWMKSDDLNI